MITVEKLEVGDVLRGRIGGVLTVRGFKEEETISGINKLVILEDNFAKGKKYIEPLARVMRSQFDVVRNGKTYECKEVKQ